MSIIEATIVLSVTAILVTTLAPVAMATVNRAQMTSTLDRMQAVADALNTALGEMGRTVLETNGSVAPPASTDVDMAVTDGDIPREVNIGGSALWQRVANNGIIDFLERHLVTNNPGGNPANGYSTLGANAWRGAYLSAPLDPDAWGNRLAVNVLFLPPSLNEDVVVYSAGPDEIIETQYGVNGLVAGGDDIIVLVQP